MKISPKLTTAPAFVALGLLTWGAGWAEAGGWFRRRAAATAAAPAPAPAPAPVPTSYSPSPYPMLGTFYPTPYTVARNNMPVGGGYMPMGIFGYVAPPMAVEGPFSPLRFYTAPVVNYARGYDGRPVTVEGYSFSTPNRPEASPVVYPTQANHYYRIRTQAEPPWRANGTNWIDQN